MWLTLVPLYCEFLIYLLQWSVKLNNHSKFISHQYPPVMKKNSSYVHTVSHKKKPLGIRLQVNSAKNVDFELKVFQTWKIDSEYIYQIVAMNNNVSNTKWAWIKNLHHSSNIANYISNSLHFVDVDFFVHPNFNKHSLMQWYFFLHRLQINEVYMYIT